MNFVQTHQVDLRVFLSLKLTVCNFNYLKKQSVFILFL